MNHKNMQLESRVLRQFPMKKYLAVFLFMLFGAYAASAQSLQSLSVGVKVGVPLIDPTTGGSDESQPYILGGSIEFRLPASFAIEADLLYQRVGESSTIYEQGGVSEIQRLRGNDWQVPFLGKYYFGHRSTGFQPYVATGWALRIVGIDETFSGTGGSPVPANESYRSGIGVGAVAAVGVRIGTQKLALTPEIRYTRWGSSTSWLNQNELSFLLGISY
jgi:hypothetical protein